MLTAKDTFHLGLVLSIDITAIVINLMLMAAIILKTPKPLRAYSVFLLNNAIIDFFSALSSALGAVRLIEDHPGGSMIFAFLGPCSLISEHLCRLCQAAHVNLVLQSTTILLLSFAYRLYILSDMFRTRDPPNRFQIWIICAISYGLISLPIISYYFVQTNLSPEQTKTFQLEGYTAASFYLFGIQALIVNVVAVVLSPIVMGIIFVVRRKLINRIAQAKTTDQKQHEFIARALTYQLMLPVGVAMSATIWCLELAQITQNEFSERIIMLVRTIIYRDHNIDVSRSVLQSMKKACSLKTYSPISVPCITAAHAVRRLTMVNEWIRDNVNFDYWLFSDECSVALSGNTCQITTDDIHDKARLIPKKKFPAKLFNMFSLASPIINFTVLPPYRALLPFTKQPTPSTSAVVPLDFTSMAA